MNNLIPNTKQISLFSDYLQKNQRCMLSARFGDGKSTFLREFIEAKHSEYHFVTIHPVNYQVSDNCDIFEYIKRDILLQLMTVFELSPKTLESFSFWRYIKDNKYDLFRDLADCLPEINLYGAINYNIGTPICSLVEKSLPGTLTLLYLFPYSQRYGTLSIIALIMVSYLLLYTDVCKCPELFHLFFSKKQFKRR